MTTIGTTLSVTLNGSAITDHIINLTRRHEICNGVGQATLITYANAVNPTTWDEIVIHENGVKKGTYYVSSYTKDARSGTMSIECQDNSKRLLDFYISERIETGGATYARTWIEYFLGQAGVSYSFTTEELGNIVPPGSSFGLSSAFDTIQTLMQQSGWYMYFNGNGVAVIGKFDVELSNPAANITESRIITVHTQKNDKMMRNRAVVWGQADTLTGGWIFADVSMPTPWDYDTSDKRTVVFSNPYIQSFGVAFELANMILSEFNRLNYEKTVTAAGFYNISLGSVVMINSSVFSGLGKVTGYTVEFSQSGVTTTIELDRRCPRLFGYFSYNTNYVYVGTWGAGVWKKYITGDTWVDFSTGLDGATGDAGKKIKDLFIKNGVFVCVADNGYAYYKNSEYSDWVKFSHGILKDSSDVEYAEDSTRAESCTINELGNILISYNYAVEGESNRSWIVYINPDGEFLRAEQVVIESDENVTMLDIESLTAEKNIISISTEGLLPNVIGNKIRQASRQGWFGVSGPGSDLDHYVALPDGSEKPSPMPATITLFGTMLGTPVVKNSRYLWSLWSNRFSVTDLQTMSTSNTSVSGLSGAGSDNWIFVPISTNEVHAVAVYTNTSPSVFTLHVKHFKWTFGDTSWNLINDIEIACGNPVTGSPGLSVRLCGDDKIVVQYQANDGLAFDRCNHKVLVYNTTGGSYSVTTYKSNYGWVNDTDTFSLGGDSGVVTGIFGVRDDGSKNLELFASWAYVDSSGAVLTYEDQVMYTFISPHSGWNIGNLVYNAYPWRQCEVDGSITSEFGWSNQWINPSDSSDYYRTHGAIVISFSGGGSTSVERVNTIEAYQTYPVDTTGLITSAKYINDDGLTQVAIAPGKTPTLMSQTYNPSSSTYDINFFSFKGGQYLGTFYGKTVQGPNSSKLVDVLSVGNQIDIDNSLYFLTRYSGASSYDLGIIGVTTGGSITKEFDTSFNNYDNVSWFGFENFLIMYDWGWNLWVISFNPPTGYASGAGYNISSHESVVGGLTSASDNAAFKSEATFNTLYEPPVACKIDISKTSPTLVYSVPPSGTYYYDLTATEKEGFLALSFTNEVDSFIVPDLESRSVFDARVFDFPVNSQLYVEDTVFTDTTPERYIMLATGTAIDVLKVNLDETVDTTWHQVVTYTTLSGDVTAITADDPLLNHIETTNFMLYPWLFVSLSGVLTTDTFWQRGDVETAFSKYSVDFPGYDTTIIRTDDYI